MNVEKELAWAGKQLQEREREHWKETINHNYGVLIDRYTCATLLSNLTSSRKFINFLGSITENMPTLRLKAKLQLLLYPFYRWFFFRISPFRLWLSNCVCVSHKQTDLFFICVLIARIVFVFVFRNRLCFIWTNSHSLFFLLHFTFVLVFMFSFFYVHTFQHCLWLGMRQWAMHAYTHYTTCRYMYFSSTILLSLEISFEEARQFNCFWKQPLSSLEMRNFLRKQYTLANAMCTVMVAVAIALVELKCSYSEYKL